VAAASVFTPDRWVAGFFVGRQRATRGRHSGARRKADMKIDRVLALVFCGLGLEACSSSTMPGFDVFKPKPATTDLLLQSNPAGADAQSSLGGTCRTPCKMAIGTAGDFTISFDRDGYEPQTRTVHSTMSEGGFTTAPSPVLAPNPVFVMLEPQAKGAARQRSQPPTAAPRLQP
jgi:PEGA domain